MDTATEQTPAQTVQDPSCEEPMPSCEEPVSDNIDAPTDDATDEPVPEFQLSTCGGLLPEFPSKHKQHFRSSIPPCVPVITGGNRGDPHNPHYPTDKEVLDYLSYVNKYVPRICVDTPATTPVDTPVDILVDNVEAPVDAPIDNVEASVDNVKAPVDTPVDTPVVDITNRERYLISIFKRLCRDIRRVEPAFPAEFDESIRIFDIDEPSDMYTCPILASTTRIVRGGITVVPNPTVEPHERFPYVPTAEKIAGTAEKYEKVRPDPFTPREKILKNILANARVYARKLRDRRYNALPSTPGFSDAGWMTLDELQLDARYDCEDLFDEFLHEVGNINVINCYEVIPPGRLCSLLIYFGFDVHVVWRPRDGSIQRCLEWTRHGDVHMCGGFFFAQQFCFEEYGNTRVEKWFHDGVPHNITNYESNRYGADLPSHWERWDYREWRIHGVLTRKPDLPSVINPMFENGWLIDGLYSRPQYPAIIWSDGCLEYWTAGLRDRKDGPAVTWRDYDGRKDEYWHDGVRVEADGTLYDWKFHIKPPHPQTDPNSPFTYCGDYRLPRNLGHAQDGQYGYISEYDRLRPVMPPAGHVDADAGYFTGRVDAFGNPVDYS